MTWSYRFPPDRVHEGGERAAKDMAAEVVEAAWALADAYAEKTHSDVQTAAVELMDVIHVAETALRHLEHDLGADLDMAWCATIAKNERRGYYTAFYALERRCPH